MIEIFDNMLNYMHFLNFKKRDAHWDNALHLKLEDCQLNPMGAQPGLGF